MLERAAKRDLPVAEIEFDYQQHEGKVSPLEPLVGQHGVLVVSFLTIESPSQTEDHLICVAITDDGNVLDQDVSSRLMTLPGRVLRELPAERTSATQLDEALTTRRTAIQESISERNARLFEAEADKLDGWADDLKLGLEREIKDLDRQIKDARRAAVAAPSLEAKLAGQKEIKALESQRGQKRRSLFDAQDEIERQRDEFGLLRHEFHQLIQTVSSREILWIRWKLV